jgi:hypothetical protein
VEITHWAEASIPLNNRILELVSFGLEVASRQKWQNIGFEGAGFKHKPGK